VFVIDSYNLIFWDFDGVIKESVDVKTQAFVKLFHRFGLEVAERIREHHETHGGVSRFEKIPLYMEWAGAKLTPLSVAQYCDQFAHLVIDEVINSPWVPGVDRYLRKNIYRQTFIVVSATPQQELDLILTALNLRECFFCVFGSPTAKVDAIRFTLSVLAIDPKDCLMIGDAKEDYNAADVNGVPFLLRRHATNSTLFSDCIVPSVNDFTEL